MQRIDENTFIDDTLVTCAEYQLFIDEMRERGEYYQPDHWISYQFPGGMAREPILGIRHSDAVAFCEWLTWRELSGLGYRLPTDIEAKDTPLKPKQASLHLGYWVMSVNNQSQFIWIYGIPKNARMLDQNLALDFVRPLDLTRPFSVVNVLSLAIDRARVRPLALAHDRANPGIVPSVLALDRTHDLYLAHDRKLDQDLIQEIDEVVDNFTLQERIAGRSPAFEGIRLVKERIR